MLLLINSLLGEEEDPPPALPIGRGACSAEFPNSAAVSISIYNARKIIGLQILIFGPAELQIRQNSGRGNQPHLASPFQEEG